MNRLAARSLFVLMLGVAWACPAISGEAPAIFVRQLLDAPAAELDFAHAKLAVDKFADPSIDETATLAELDGMAATIHKMLGTLPPEQATTSMEKMKALRAFLYEPGRWNGGKPFQYDLSDPFGQQPGAQMLTRYLATKKGNCISMPMLFLALGERLGLNLTLSTAPLHVFVKFTDDATGKTWNLETTSGAGFARDEHYRKITPMTDEAVRNGVYLKTMSRREALAIIATGILDNLIATGRYEDAITVADVLIEAGPDRRLCDGQEGHSLLSAAGSGFHQEISERKRHSVKRDAARSRTAPR
ncbi:transglutaminase family protein [Mesorhizobium sp. B2-4-19]|uniref:transglutaminase family protein n=1 Tax=Mesorhizobium sp. B2-4-19 TaxID=2589930 RepID=UPI0015E3A64C|nr:transglutaminase family protein [Mesorhizobium sp. B2-4-19]